MLTRLKVSGFKNLVDVDVRLGPFTCIAGANGIGKSNLFDAIRFLSALADRPLIDAAKSVRDDEARSGDVLGLFHRVGETADSKMSLEVEMLVPRKGADDLGQQAEAGVTFLRYLLELTYRPEARNNGGSGLEILREELGYIKKGEAQSHLMFRPSRTWRQSVVTGRRTSMYISTESDNGKDVIELHQDGVGGRPVRRSRAALPRTVLSSVYAAENPTALLARREMQSWQLLQLEPSAMRRSDDFTAPTRIGSNGSHLAATLYHLAKSKSVSKSTFDVNGHASAEQMYAQVANRLAELINDVRSVWIDRDEKRELLTLFLTDQDGTSHPARALSDGTLRFLALAIMELDSNSSGLLCLEEPENGIHPARIPAMIRLLRDIATDTSEAVGSENPLRQVIVNTHSPSVVAEVPEDSLLVAEFKEAFRDDKPFKHVSFACLQGTWRANVAEKAGIVDKGRLLEYLNPFLPPEAATSGVVQFPSGSISQRRLRGSKRVIDREDLPFYRFWQPVS